MRLYSYRPLPLHICFCGAARVMAEFHKDMLAAGFSAILGQKKLL